MQKIETRDLILERLFVDLVGPFEESEVLNSRPTDVYLTGILWPQRTQMSAEDDERLGVDGASVSDVDSAFGIGEEEAVSIRSMNRPSTAGISCALKTDKGNPSLNIKITFGTYKSQETEDNHQYIKQWKRSDAIINIENIILEKDTLALIDLSKYGAVYGVRLHLRTVLWRENWLATITLVNDVIPNPADGRDGIEHVTLFQTKIEIRSSNGTTLVARPSRRAVIDEDDKSDALIYRSALEFAVGHNCSAEWEPGQVYGTASLVRTAWIPKVMVSSTSTEGHTIFNRLRTMNAVSPLSTEWLATANKDHLVKGLSELPKTYLEWINLQENKISCLDNTYKKQAKTNLDICRDVATRISNGVTIISENDYAAEAFRLANRAMNIQYNWDTEKSKHKHLEWRPFQLGFILLSLPSIIEKDAPDRSVMDLLWFPTGGGKTEAYLALIAFLAFYRRLSNVKKPDESDGVNAIMRYTLRLLTTQQFARATSMILACELIRREYTSKNSMKLGQTPFSIGLWVGGEATPNRYEDAIESLSGNPNLPSPKQLSECPACKETLEWQADSGKKAIFVYCRNKQCDLYSIERPLPIYTVDDDVYRERPTLVIGTIDKFAQIVRRKEIQSFFAVRGNPPDLIIQDELHLISGPLGTVAGIYETAIDRLFSEKGNIPKIIGSTATIRRATEQVKSLFNRGICQFPPPAIDSIDSGFAMIDTTVSGRIYASITTAGRSAKFTLQAVAASLLQSVFSISKDNAVRDPYWTLVLYFNALRELGGALVLMQDDVNDSLKMIAQRRKEEQRLPKIIEELTSRRTQEEVKDMLKKLSLHAGEEGALDAVLATNMLSVGVDIPRLGLMLVNGQPKGIAEYIQATSRVGRGQVPGLIVTVLNNAKARDKSHFESFGAWHTTLYRDVEATSVTPFASRARDRALHAVLVTLVRHLVPGMLDNPRLDEHSIAAAKKLMDEITKRASLIDREEINIALELQRLLDNWHLREPQYYWNAMNPDQSLLQDAERAATLKALGRQYGNAWSTMNNMRSVEPSCRFRLVQKLR
jgi:superfamily II DNA or RNA helicase